jgi:hypothetical protein
MTGQNYHISSYCSIRQGQVALNGQNIFRSSEENMAAVFSDIYRHFGISYPKFYKMDQLCKLGFITSEILLQQKDLNHVYGSEGTGLIFFNAASSINTDRNHQQSIQNRSAYFPSPSVFVYTLANIVIGEVCIRHKFFGESAFFIERKFDAERLVSYVKLLLDSGALQCCITGWLDSDGEQYDGILYLVEKSAPDNNGIAIFEAEKINDIYLQRT